MQGPKSTFITVGKKIQFVTAISIIEDIVFTAVHMAYG
jgi:hypothetical protein